LTHGDSFPARVYAWTAHGGDYSEDKTFVVPGGTASGRNLLENASFALGATPPPGCGTTYDWTAYPNGGSLAKCDYASESGAEQGGSFLEMNDTAEGGSVGQDVPFTPRVGQTYTFSVWLRAPAAAVNGTVAIYSINGAGQAFDQGNTKYTLTGGGAWKRVEVPLTVTLTEATKIRVQVYEQTKNTNIDIDGAQLLNSGLENASFALGATPPPGCGTTYDWTAYPNGGSLAKCDYASESGAEQGGSFLEINDTAEG